MTRSTYESAQSAKVIEAARTGVAEQLRRDLRVLQEPPAEIRELLARLVALDSAGRRTAERRAVASSPLQLPLPGATSPRG